MILFNTFFKVINKYKGTIILYTVMLIIFGGINTTAENKRDDFTDSKPNVKIVNKDDSSIADNLVDYLSDVSEIKDIAEEKLDDAIFYRDVNLIVYIPHNYGASIRSEEPLNVEVKKVGDFKSMLAFNILNHYLNVQEIYKDEFTNDEELIKNINSTLESSAKISLMSKLDTKSISSVSSYYSFASYSIMAVIIFIICLVMSSFNSKNVRKRTIVSSKSIISYNAAILAGSILYGLLVFVLFNLLGVFMLGDIMFTLRGLIYIINSFMFVIVSITLALFISSLLNNKDAISGIVNVVSLGSAFLCGAFVPAEMLPSSVLSFAHVLPAYYYINSNDLLKSIEVINLSSLEPVIKNMFILLVFSLVFIVLNIIFTKVLRQRVN